MCMQYINQYQPDSSKLQLCDIKYDVCHFLPIYNYIFYLPISNYHMGCIYIYVCVSDYFIYICFFCQYFSAQVTSFNRQIVGEHFVEKSLDIQGRLLKRYLDPLKIYQPSTFSGFIFLFGCLWEYSYYERSLHLE